jgi:predicted glutamine amidotransferase
MCKLFAIVEIEDRKNAEYFAKRAVPFITRNDDHGLGIMRLGENGIHIQRWVEVPQIVSMRSTLNRYKNVLQRDENQEGVKSRNLYGIAVHGRYATCDINIKNTHPFFRDGTALMHNGIIRNHYDFDKPLSTCDSEALLTRYIDAGVIKHHKLLTDAMKPIQGYFACIVFNNNGVIDIWRDNSATLHMAHVKGVGVVIATTAEIILDTAKACKARVTDIKPIRPYTAIRWNKGKLPIIKRFHYEEPKEDAPKGGNFCGTGKQRSLFPEHVLDDQPIFDQQGNMVDGEPIVPLDKMDTNWQDRLEEERNALYADDYELAKIRGFKGTLEDYARSIEGA